jgi:ATP-dependent Zn protease
MTDVIEADCERRKSAFHEAGHAVACVAWGIPIYAASIAPRPQVRHSLWFHANDGTRLQRMAAMRLAGSAAERFFCGAAEDDPADIEKAREYVAYVVPPSEIE